MSIFLQDLINAPVATLCALDKKKSLYNIFFCFCFRSRVPLKGLHKHKEAKYHKTALVKLNLGLNLKTTVLTN